VKNGRRMSVVRKGQVGVTEKAVPGLGAPIRHGVVEVMDEAVNGRIARKPTLMGKPSDAQAIHRNVCFRPPVAVVPVIVPILAIAAQAGSVHSSMGAIAVNEERFSDPNSKRVPMKSVVARCEFIETLAEERGTIVIAQHIVNLAGPKLSAQ
jgi:hypothetical protein